MPEKRNAAHRSYALIAGMAAVALTATAPVSEAQAGHNLERPAHWKVAHPGTQDEVERPFVVMRPGWHVFSGVGALLWDPGSFASGNYSVTSEMFLFPSTEIGTPYGVFLGGGQLEGESSAYISFQIRNDRRYRVARHGGGRIDELVPWTEHADILSVEQSSGGPVENRISVDVRDGVVAFYINDAWVAELPRPGLPAEGTIGLAVGDGLSLHVTNLRIGPNRSAG